MEEIEGLVRALGEGDDAAKIAAAGALGALALVTHARRSKDNKVLIAEAGGIPPLVQLLRDGTAEAKAQAARALGRVAYYLNDNQILIAEAGGIPPLVDLLRSGSAMGPAKFHAAWALWNLAHNVANKDLIAAAGGIPPLVELLRDGMDAKSWAAAALRHLAVNNDANAVAIAATAGFEALVQLTRRGRVTFENQPVVLFAPLPAKRKAALVVAALLRDCVPDEARSQVRDLIRGVIGPYL